VLFPESLLGLLLPTLFAFYLIRYAVKKIQQYSEDGPFSTITVCRNCNEPNQKGAQFCKKCNQPVNLEFYDICKTCNERVLSDAGFCEHCGTSTQHNESENLDQT
jgi:ribosomal protein L40E